MAVQPAEEGSTLDTEQLPYSLMAAVTNADWAALDAMCADDIESEWLDLMKFTRRDAFKHVYRVDHRQHTNFRAEVVELLVRDDTSVCF